VTTAGGSLKGAGIVPFLRWYCGHFGEEQLRRAASALPAADRAHFDLRDGLLGVLASSWYPAPVVHALLDRLQLEHPGQRELLAREGARAVIDTTLRGVYRWLFETMMTPERYGRNAQKLFSRYNDTGVMTKEPLPPAGHLSRVRDWSGHHPLLCDMLLHTADYVYSALGCREVKVRRVTCVSEGAPECRFDITWAP
jgi:hypothetical protein